MVLDTYFLGLLQQSFNSALFPLKYVHVPNIWQSTPGEVTDLTVYMIMCIKYVHLLFHHQKGDEGCMYISHQRNNIFFRLFTSVGQRKNSDQKNYFYFQVFQGNLDRDSIVKLSLSTDVKARYVRFYPVTFSGYPCMRVEIFVLNWPKKHSLIYQHILTQNSLYDTR